MTGELEGKVAIVTGGSRGIGRAIAEKFVGAGADVTITGRNVEVGEATAAELGVRFIGGHAGKIEEIERTIDDVISESGRIDVLVNNAATNPYAGPTVDVDLARWQKTFDTNVTGPLMWTQMAWTKSMKENGGAVVNVSSVGAFNTNEHIGVYDITKSTLLHLTRQLAAEMAPQVRVNAVAPGLIKTDFAKFLWEDGKGDQVAQAYPMKRLGEPEDIANATLFLAADSASWIAGQCITIDGGGEVGFSNLG